MKEKIVVSILMKIFSHFSVEDVIILLGGREKILAVFKAIADNLTDKQREEFRESFFGSHYHKCECNEIFKEDLPNV